MLGFNRPDKRNAEAKAQGLIDEFLIIAPPVNPIEIARDLGVGVTFASFSGASSGISGYFDCEDNSIYVNKEEFSLRQTFTIAHELGHKVLHEDWARSQDYQVLWRDQSKQIQDFRETEANTFAACLLMPREMMDRYVNRLNPQQLSSLFAVSLPAMRNRLSALYGI